MGGGVGLTGRLVWGLRGLRRGVVIRGLLFGGGFLVGWFWLRNLAGGGLFLLVDDVGVAGEESLDFRLVVVEFQGVVPVFQGLFGDGDSLFVGEVGHHLGDAYAVDGGGVVLVELVGLLVEVEGVGKSLLA